MKLHLGCGDKIWPGYINCDLTDSDHDCDIRSLPFDSDSADEIVAIHVVEHFFITEVKGVIQEWHRVLKTGGQLIVELPCWDKVKLLIKQDASDKFTRLALYGDPMTHSNGIEAVHKFCYEKQEMAALLRHGGFQKIESHRPLFHEPDRDMRWVATK